VSWSENIVSRLCKHDVVLTFSQHVLMSKCSMVCAQWELRSTRVLKWYRDAHGSVHQQMLHNIPIVRVLGKEKSYWKGQTTGFIYRVKQSLNV